MPDLFAALNKDKLVNDMCSCSDCGWEGPVTSCGRYEDDDGWESCVRYTVFTCPLCSLSGSEGCVDDFYHSIDAAIERARARQWLDEQRVIEPSDIERAELPEAMQEDGDAG